MAIIYREMQLSDYDELVELWKAAPLSYRPQGRDHQQNIKRQLGKDGNLFLCAFRQEKMIGFVMATHNNRKGWINRLVVHPDFRKQKIGTILIGKAEEFFRENKVEIFACLIENWNNRSMKFFEKINYKAHPEIGYYTKRKDPQV